MESQSEVPAAVINDKKEEEENVKESNKSADEAQTAVAAPEPTEDNAEPSEPVSAPVKLRDDSGNLLANPDSVRRAAAAIEAEKESLKELMKPMMSSDMAELEARVSVHFVDSILVSHWRA